MISHFNSRIINNIGGEKSSPLILNIIMQCIRVKIISKKYKSSTSNLIRNNQNMREYFRFEDNTFKNHQEAFIYFKNYYLNKYNYIGSIKIKITKR